MLLIIVLGPQAVIAPSVPGRPEVVALLISYCKELK